MSIIDRLLEYKEQYDEMDPYRRNQLHIVVVGVILLAITLYTIVNSLESVRSFFNL